MTYDEAKKLILGKLDNNPAAHPALEEALEVLLFESVKAAGTKPVAPPQETPEPESKGKKK